jgi:hypothetical protein
MIAITIEWLALLLCILEDAGLNLGHGFPQFI